MGAGDMETVGPSSSNELGSKTNGSLPPTVDPSLSAEDGLRFISTHLFICSGIFNIILKTSLFGQIECMFFQ